jgi:redox-sensing transcriptional repressor
MSPGTGKRRSTPNGGAARTELGRPLMKRLASYHQMAAQAAERGLHHVSSSSLAELLDIDDSLVRKDMAVAGISGRPKVGYDLAEILARLEDLLGLGARTEAILVGCGYLGSAILGYPGFSAYGMRITAVFDTDTEKVGREIAGHQVLPMEKCRSIIDIFRVQIAVLTVPASAAQEVADFLVGRGVKAIWNFAPVILRVPPGVTVRNENLALGLVRLIHSLKQETDREGAAAR